MVGGSLPTVPCTIESHQFYGICTVLPSIAPLLSFLPDDESWNQYWESETDK